VKSKFKYKNKYADMSNVKYIIKTYIIENLKISTLSYSTWSKSVSKINVKTLVDDYIF